MFIEFRISTFSLLGIFHRNIRNFFQQHSKTFFDKKKSDILTLFWAQKKCNNLDPWEIRRSAYLSGKWVGNFTE